MTKALLLMALLQTGTVAEDRARSTDSFETELEALHETEGDAESAFERLEHAVRWKVPVNTASAESLREVPGLSERELTHVLSHRAAIGPITGLDDLIAAGLSEDAATALLPFLSFSERPRAPASKIRIDLVQRLSRRLDIGKGYAGDDSSGYLGTPAAVQSRLTLRYGRSIFAGIMLDKDAGEPFTFSPREGLYGPDFASVHVGIDGAGPFERLVVGGFSVRSGEGLLLGQGMAGMSALRVASTGRLLRPQTSSRESSYFRGIALQSRPLHGASAAAFVSKQALDGRRDSVEGGWRLVAPGTHRTGLELGGRRLIRSLVLGGLISWSRGSLRLGGQAVRSRFGLDETARSVTSVSFFGGWVRPRWALSTEFLPDLAHGSLTVSFAPLQDARLAVRARRTSAGPMRPHSPAGVDSRGASVAMREWEADGGFRPFAAWSARFHLRGRTSGDALHAPKASRSANLRLQYRPRDWFSLELRGTARMDRVVAACEAAALLLRCNAGHLRRSLRTQAEYHHSASLRSRSRLELVHVSRRGPSTERSETKPVGDPVGFLMYEDLRWRAGESIQIDARFAIFETSDPSARVVAFENDVLYAFSAPSFSGRGRRWYVLARADPTGRLSLQLKLASTVYEDVTRVGSGLDEVAGRRVREVKLQIRWRFGP